MPLVEIGRTFRLVDSEYEMNAVTRSGHARREKTEIRCGSKRPGAAFHQATEQNDNSATSAAKRPDSQTRETDVSGQVGNRTVECIQSFKLFSIAVGRPTGKRIGHHLCFIDGYSFKSQRDQTNKQPRQPGTSKCCQVSDLRSSS